MVPSPAVDARISRAAGDDLLLVPLLTPTLPPALHTNMMVIAGPGLVVDPGARDLGERRRALHVLGEVDAGSSPLQAIWLTHHHRDHTGAAAWLSDRLGLPIWGHPRTGELLRPRRPLDRAFSGGEEIPRPRGGGSGWTALHTPGHAEGHLCLWHEATGRLVAGDMVAGTGTILIDPDDGDMRLYLESLEALCALSPRLLIPAHGPVLSGAVEVLRFYIRHRLERERKILDAVGRGRASFGRILARAYGDVPVQAHPVAARSLESHLRKLEADGRIRRGRGWVRRKG